MTESAVLRRESTGVRPYKDLREWLQIVDEMGELRVIRGADWDLELAAITEIARTQSKEKPSLLFDDIKGYPTGFRVLTGMANTVSRLALITGMPPTDDM